MLASILRLFAMSNYHIDAKQKLLDVPAARIIKAMNRSVDPCRDFYKFACGGWISKNPIPQSQTSWDQLSLLKERLLKDLRILLEESDDGNDLRSVKLARTLYRTCMNLSKNNRFILIRNN